MTELRPICIILVAATACATAAPDEIEPYYESTKSDGSRPKLKLKDDDKLHVDEPSDLAFFDGQLYTVSDRVSKIYAITKNGDVEDDTDVAAQDLEALAIDPDGDFVIADESDTKVWFVDKHGERTKSFDVDDVDDGNSGIEGLAFDDDGHLYVAKEKDPARIYKLDKNGDQLDRKKIELADDLSALAWNPRDGHLYALSDLDESLYRLDKDFDADAAWRLPVKHPEGIAFDGKTLYVVSDSEERIYEFELEDD